MPRENTNSEEKAAPLPANMRNMFDRLAPFYDRVNRVISLGQDEHWRRLAVELATGPDSKVALDVATGTGRMALALAKKYPRVAGIDVSAKMIAQGRDTLRSEPLSDRIEFVLGEALRMPFPDNSFDCAVIGFATRNVENLRQCFSEMRRVIKPNGAVVCLELSKPPQRPINAAYQFYLHKIVPLLGGRLSGRYGAYKYLAHSLVRFPPAVELKKLMEEVGMREVRFRRLNLGTIAIHWGVK